MENSVNLARQYVDQSNAHNLDTILSMFDEEATYHSSQVGTFKGKTAIANMMSNFFARFPDVNWKVSSYHPASEGGVEFEFTMCASDIDTGEKIERRGLERIMFTIDNLITHIEVNVLSD